MVHPSHAPATDDVERLSDLHIKTEPSDTPTPSDASAQAAELKKESEEPPLRRRSTSRRRSSVGRHSLGRRDSIGSALARHESIADAASLASIDRPPSEQEQLPPAKVYHPLSPAVLALLMPASVFGLLARLGIEALVTYDGHSIFPLAYAQGLGCLIMGIALRLKDPIGGFYGPLYTALTTGFCGSLTTFSGWQLDVFNSWINEGQFRRDWLRDVIDGCTKLFFTLSVALASFSFGIHVGTILEPYIPIIRPPRAYIRHSITLLSILIYFATYPAYFHLPTSFRHQATAALLFCFPGTLTRYLLSLQLNPRYKLIPVGTLVANSFGTAILAMCHVLQGLPNPVSANSCALLQGVADGYCGCLTTVSTFAAEVTALEIRKRWFYATLSIVVGQLLMLVVLGPSFWSGGVSPQGTCATV